MKKFRTLKYRPFCYLYNKMKLVLRKWLFCLILGSIIAIVGAQNPSKIKIFTTQKSNDTSTFVQQYVDSFYSTISMQPTESEVFIVLNTKKQFQTYLGMGAAITDAAAETYGKLSVSDKKKLMQLYFSEKEGLGYKLIRTNMNSCDFSSESYTYVKENDQDLSSFSIQHDMKFKIPMIQDAIKCAGLESKVYISPWSPPAYMKSNKNMLHGGSLLPEFYPLWSKYFVKYIQALEKEKIPVWGLTIQNEPMATQIWESCIFTAEQEKLFLRNHLGPTLKQSGLGDKKIIVWDHNRDLMYHRAAAILGDSLANSYVWGIGYHWYETWTGADPLHENLGKVQQLDPSKKMLFTEGCKEKFQFNAIQDWKLGEKYAMNIIQDFNQGVVGWTDWNLLLDDKGGPNHVGNYCFAPIHIGFEGVKKEAVARFYITNAFYYLGHFSKFLKVGAKRIESVVSRSTLKSTAFINPTGQKVMVVLNSGNEEIAYKILVDENTFSVKIPAHGIQSITLN